MKDLLHELWQYFESDKRKSFIGLLLLMVLASFAEVMSLGIVMKKKETIKMCRSMERIKLL